MRKSEQLAMKVRYETKLEKIQRDYNQLLINSERVSREKELQQEIIKGVQRGMSNLKDKYTQEKSRWKTDKEQFEQKANEVSSHLPTIYIHFPLTKFLSQSLKFLSAKKYFFQKGDFPLDNVVTVHSSGRK